MDVSFLRSAGTDLASRVRLVELPACAVTTPDKASCAQRSPLAGAELEVATDGGLQASGVVDLPAATPPGDLAQSGSLRATEQAAESRTTVLAVVSEASGPNGDWTASSLSPSASWQVSGNTGAFSWSYPLRSPSTPGGLAPDLSLSYSSSSLDGKVASGNVQSSQIGDGWEASLSGFVERKYVSCTDDQQANDAGATPNNVSKDTGDLCWKTNNATLVLNGAATELVRDGATSVWRPKNDDNTKVQRLTGGWGDSRSGEYWLLTTPDGTKYYFGRSKRTATGSDLFSTLSVPVYGNHPGEPCYAASYASARCDDQGWRWMLDHVVDTRGNSMTYRYTREFTNYGHNNNEGVSRYAAGVQLSGIEYGTTTANQESVTAPARINFGYSERCIPTPTFDCAVAKRTVANSAHWPDVPIDQICTSTTSCPGTLSPTFYDLKRLTAISTSVRVNGAYVGVDRWAFGQTMPSVGASMPTVWLDNITHQGLGGTTDTEDDVSLPAVTFGWEQKANRVGTPADDETAMTRRRVSRITSESGGVIEIAYSGQECAPDNLPSSPWTNTKRCFPVYWTQPGRPDPVEEYFHHYRVEKITESAGSAIGGTPVLTDWIYTGGPAWHYDDNELVKPKHRTWGELRGYAKVETRVGEPGNSERPPVRTVSQYFRGMHGDWDNRTGSVKKSEVIDGIDDLDRYAGVLRAETSLNGSATVATTLSTPWTSVATAINPENGTDKAFHTGIATQQTTTVAPERTSGDVVTRVETEFDSYGMPEKVRDLGDYGASGDERCTATTYARNLDDNILTLPSRVNTVVAECTPTPDPDDVISDVRYSYDGGFREAAPTRGLLTRTEEIDHYDGTTPVYESSTTTYEPAGTGYARAETSTDMKGRVTSTQYTQSADGLTTRTKVTSPDPDGTGALTEHVAFTDYNPVWGVPLKITDANNKVTAGAYDVLGRLVSVWEPGRSQASQTPNTKIAYVLSGTGMNAVTTQTLNFDGSAYQTSSTVYDGLLRPIQTQAPSASSTRPGRVMTDTIYDSRNLPVKTNDGWYATGTPSASMVIPSSAVPARTVTEFDGAGRATSATFYVGQDGAPHDDGSYDPTWTTTTTYRGDRVHTDPPAGGTPTTVINNTRGQTIELRQYEGSSTSGTYHPTKYLYDHADRLKRATDDAGNVWTYGYDLRGRQTSATDPDAGSSSSTYDAVGNILTKTDGRGQVLGYTYDALDRRRSVRTGGTTGTVRATWTYDSVAKGQVATSTRVGEGGTYTNAITGYSNDYQPTGQRTTLPTSSILGSLSGQSYTTDFTYTTDGRLQDTVLPAAGSLAAETVRVGYDSANQPSWLVGAGDFGIYAATSKWSPYGQLEYMDLGNTHSYQHTLVYEWGTRRLDQVVQSAERADGSVVAVADAAYGWDDAGNLTSVKDTPDPLLGGQPSDQQCYQYDWARRLSEAWTPNNGDCATAPSGSTVLGGGAPYWNSYTHSMIGNRTTAVTRTPSGASGPGSVSTTSTYTYPTSGAGVGRPHAVTQVAATGAKTGTSTFDYDTAGNMTARAVAGKTAQALAWDAEGELASVASDTDGDGTVEETEKASSDKYVYTADGDRFVRFQGSTVTVYLPGGQEVSLDKTTSTIKATRYYAFAGKTIATRTGMAFSQVATLIPDHHNTAAVQITNVTSAVTRRFTDPYGAARGANPAGWFGDHGFLDKPTDATELTQIGARYYDASLGRFITVDPVMDLTDPQQWNAYSYANNNPTTMSDPDGLEPRPIHERDPGGGSCAGFTENNCGGGSEDIVAQPSSPSIPDEYYTPPAAGEHASSIISTYTTSVPLPQYVRAQHTIGYTAMAGLFSPQTEQALGWASWVSPFADATQLGLYLACAQKNCTVYENAGQSAALSAAGILVPGGNVAKPVDEIADAGNNFYRGSRSGETPSFIPRPNEFKVDSETGFVRGSHGVSVFDNPDSLSKKGFTPRQIDMSTVPDELTIIQRGNDPRHFEIVPRPGANLTPDQFSSCLSRIQCG